MLDLKIAEVFKHEREIVIREIRRKLELHQLTVDDVRGRSRQLIAKIRDPKTGRVWSGRGRKPSWVDAARSGKTYPLRGKSPRSDIRAAPGQTELS
ncbi:H-NS histone family protein [Paraburkholderia nodosa]|uniref:H-NS histone family protein n=1 Tax=Paraburkholderia nodosa TaxID=392320 RepID=UPI003F952F9F